MGSPLRLAHRFALATFGIGVLLVAALVTSQTLSARRALHEKVQANSEVLLEAVASLCEAHLADNNESMLLHELQSLIESPRFAYIDVYSPSGKPLIQLVHRAHHRGRRIDETIDKVRDNVLDLEKPIDYKGRLLGRLMLGVWVEGIGQDIRAIAWHGLALGLGLTALLGWVSWWLGRRLSRRLSDFSEYLSTRGLDDYQPYSVPGRDEISAVAWAFNDRQERLREARERQRAAEQQRQEMVEMIIHDLKGPLGALAAGLSFLEDKDGQGELTEAMKKGTERLSRMVDSILQVARLEDPNQRLPLDPVRVDELARLRVEQCRPLALRQGVRISAEDAAPAAAMGHGETLARVLDNLLFNALEHSAPGGQVSVAVRPEGEFIRVEVRDSGPGIAPSERDLIFEKFRKGKALSRGVGLGLSFCRLAVERLGGRIGVTDAPGGGALFYFLLPATSGRPIGIPLETPVTPALLGQTFP